MYSNQPEPALCKSCVGALGSAGGTAALLLVRICGRKHTQPRICGRKHTQPRMAGEAAGDVPMLATPHEWLQCTSLISRLAK